MRWSCKPGADGQEVPRHPALPPPAAVVPSGRVLPVARAAPRDGGTAGEGSSNLGVGSEAVLTPCSSSLKNGVINESNGMKEPETK